MTGTNCDLFTHKSSRSYLNHLVHNYIFVSSPALYKTKLKVIKSKDKILKKGFIHFCAAVVYNTL